jgi:nitrogen fixation protein NifU and related proteins
MSICVKAHSLTLESFRIMDKYSKILFSEFKNPFHEGLPEALRKHLIFSKTKHNPTCGDECKVSVVKRKTENNTDMVSGYFEGHMCSVTKASASVLMKLIEEKSVQLKVSDADEFISLYKSEISLDEAFPESDLGGILKALESFRNFPSRQKCVLLPWVSYKEGIISIDEEK